MLTVKEGSMRWIIVMAALLSAASACEKIVWKPPVEKEAQKTAVKEGHKFDTRELMAGPYLLMSDGGAAVVRFEVQGEGCGDGIVVVDGQRIAAIPVATPEDDGRLQGTVCDALLPPLPSCRPFTYALEPFEKVKRNGRLPPHAGAHCPAPFKILVLGDTRTGHDIHREVVAMSMAEEASFIINLGDIVELNQRVEDWYRFFDIERNLLPGAPFVLIPGNHETWWDVEFGALMLNRFFRAGESGGTGHHTRDAGRVHMVFLDAYWGEDLVNEGRDWLRADLAAVPADRVTVVFVHEPPISFGAHRPRPPIKRLMPLFQEMGVAAVVAGHAHIYEHFVIEGLHYVTAGGGGAGLHKPDMNVVTEQEEYLVKNSSEHHYLLLTVGDDSVNFTVKRIGGETLEAWAVPLPVL